MDKLVITKSPALHGDVIISGAKNAALPLLMASLLADSEITFNNVPALRDITTSVKLLQGMGTKVNFNNKNS
ncbi:MAG TPA: UDP-N-acetylglucosamine 1-carboxyvinyltransferase, partial [Glaciecola sp.]|nr:UDP-N-acetylglucosamine 1-carboxyvinyltransferase [Glaciecola sp.]